MLDGQGPDVTAVEAAVDVKWAFGVEL